MRATSGSFTFLLAMLVPPGALPAQETRVETQLLLPPEPGMQYTISPKGLHVAGVMLRGSRQVLVYDGVDGPRFDQVLNLSYQNAKVAWSDDGARHAYHGKLGQEYVIVVDGKEDGKPAPYLAGGMQWTADSKHLITRRAIPRTANEEILADGQPIMRVPGGIELTMAPVGPGMLGRVWAPTQDGTRVSYLLVGNRRVAGSECSNAAGLDAVYLSSDAKHFAARCAMTFMLVDGKKGQEYPEGLSALIWTSEGRPVYYGRTNQRAFMIIGEQESDAWGTILDIPPSTREERNTVNTPHKPAVVRGTHVAYIARTNAGDGNSTVVVVDGKAIPAVAASEVSLSPDGTRFAFISGWPNQFVTVDGTAYDKAAVVPGIGNIGYQGTIQWSPDSKHVAWITAAPSNGVMLDGKQLGTPGMTRFARFSATGRLVYLARGQGAESQIYVDGRRVLTLPQNLSLENDADIYWDFPGDGSIRFVAQDGEGMKRFRIMPN